MGLGIVSCVKKLVVFLIFERCEISRNCFVYYQGGAYVRLRCAPIHFFHVANAKIQGELILTPNTFFSEIFRCLSLHTIQYTALTDVKIYDLLSYKLSDKTADKIDRSKVAVRNWRWA